MAGRGLLGICGFLTLAMIILTITLPIVFISRINDINYDANFGTEGTPLFLNDNQTTTVTGVANYQMVVYRWDWNERDKSINNTYESIQACFNSQTQENVIVYMQNERVPTEIDYRLKMVSPNPNTWLYWSQCIELTNCGGSLYIGVTTNSTSLSMPYYSINIQRTQGIDLCGLGKAILGYVGTCILAGIMGCISCCCCIGFVVMASNYRRHRHHHYTRVDIHTTAIPATINTVYPPQPGYYQPQYPQQHMPASYPQQPVQYASAPPAYNPNTPLLNPKLNGVD